MHGAGRGYPPGRDAVHPGPGEPSALVAAAPQRLKPVPYHLGAEGVHRIAVAGHRVVSLVPAYHGGQPSSLFGEGQAPAPPELGFQLGQLGPCPFGVGFPPDPEPPAPGGRADVREAQERERLRFSLAPCRPVPGGTPPELDQPGLIRVQFQPEPGEPAAQLVPELLGVLPVLEPDDEVSSRGSGSPEEPPLRAPTDPGVTLSRHRALIILSASTNSPGASARTLPGTGELSSPSRGGVSSRCAAAGISCGASAPGSS